jgi:3-phenylpropionate/trans-cinnamate dioxygenase ferredoxin subunit
MVEWVHVTASDALPEGEMLEHQHRGEPIVVARTEAGLFAFDGWCTHEECPLSEGILNDREVECYCHGAVFDLRTGEALIGPALESLTTYPVREHEGAIEIEV